MSQKLYLNKYLKVDNIEYYTLPCLIALLKEYDKLLQKTDGIDPDFPQLNFSGETKGLKLTAKNKIDEKSKKLLDDIWKNQKAGTKD